MKGNQVIPNAHFHKDWQNRVKTWFNQPARKLRRRQQRQKKASAIAPRPVAGHLRPAVHGQTVRYNMKLRSGRGFTFEELKEAGINKKEALTLGIAVDHRRKNRSLEGLQANVQRLKEYKANLVVFPKNAKKPAKALAAASQCTDNINAIVKKSKNPARKITKEEAEFSAYAAIRAARSEKRFWGIRKKRAEDKAREEAERKK